MDIVIYKKSDIVRAVECLNSLNTTGVQNAKLISAICEIIDSGEIAEREEEGEDGVGR